jgi:hypothetical protein
VSYIQNFFVDQEIEFDEQRFDERLDEVIDDKCNDEVITHVLSQLKKEHIVDAFLCYNVSILDDEHFEFIRHET